MTVPPQQVSTVASPILKYFLEYYPSSKADRQKALSVPAIYHGARTRCSNFLLWAVIHTLALEDQIDFATYESSLTDLTEITAGVAATATSTCRATGPVQQICAEGSLSSGSFRVAVR